MTNQRHLHCHKIWQTKERKIILLLSCAHMQIVSAEGESDERWSKFFLSLDVNQQSFGIYRLEEKPEGIGSKVGGFAQLLRKYLDGAALISVLHDQGKNDFWLQFGEEKYLQLLNGKPPEIRFILSSKEILMRMSSQGLYTKRRKFEGEFPQEQASKFRDITSTFLRPLRERIREEADGDGETAGITQKQRQILRSLRRKLKTLRKALQKTVPNLKENKSILEHKHHAELLKNFAYLVKPNSDFALIPGHLSGDGKDISIALDKTVSVGENINLLFAKIKKLQKSFDINVERRAQNEKEIADAEKSITDLEQNLFSAPHLEEIQKRFQLKDVNQISGARSSVGKKTREPYITFLIDDIYIIYVGKAAKDNDELTKHAASNDWWLHVSGVSGSHVIVPYHKSMGDKIDDGLLRKACILALHYSKRKNQRSGEVYYTRRQYLKKTKGMAPGQWQVLRGKTARVKYEPEELQEILQMRQR